MGDRRLKNKPFVEEKIIAVLMCVMVVMVAAQVLGRYVFHSSLSFTEEIVRYLFVWATFIGAAAAVRGGRHLSISSGIRLLPASVRRWNGVLCWTGAVVFATVLVVYGIRVVSLQIRTGQTTAALGFPMWVVGLAIPVSAILLVVRLAAFIPGFMRKSDAHGGSGSHVSGAEKSE